MTISETSKNNITRFNGSQVRLFFTRSRVRGGWNNPPCCSQNYSSEYRKKCQGVRKRYFIDKYAIFSQLKHFVEMGANRIFVYECLFLAAPVHSVI